jgi:hypothetical protein
VLTKFVHLVVMTKHIECIPFRLPNQNSVCISYLPTRALCPFHLYLHTVRSLKTHKLIHSCALLETLIVFLVWMLSKPRKLYSITNLLHGGQSMLRSWYLLSWPRNSRPRATSSTPEDEFVRKNNLAFVLCVGGFRDILLWGNKINYKGCKQRP